MNPLKSFQIIITTYKNIFTVYLCTVNTYGTYIYKLMFHFKCLTHFILLNYRTGKLNRNESTHLLQDLIITNMFECNSQHYHIIYTCIYTDVNFLSTHILRRTLHNERTLPLYFREGNITRSEGVLIWPTILQ